MYLYLFEMPRSKSALELHKQAIKEREKFLNKEKALARQFNDPLKTFIQRKYYSIYKEYCELFHRMKAESPTRRDLQKTLVFKQFLLDNPDNVVESEQTRAEQEQADNGNSSLEGGEECASSSVALYVPRLELQPVLPIEQGAKSVEVQMEAQEESRAQEESVEVQMENPGAQEESRAQEEEPNILAQALADIIESDPGAVDSAEHAFRVETVHNMLEEMANEVVFKNVLNEVEVDLSGEINYFDAFERDIQLFNH